MGDFKAAVVLKGDHCHPQHRCPDPHEHDHCEGTIKLDCHCAKLRTQTFIVNIGPQSEPSLNSFLQTTVNAWEAAGFLILGHSLIDTGAGWMLGLTVGWYV